MKFFALIIILKLTSANYWSLFRKRDSFGGKKVIIASTSEIYGKDRPGKHTFKEDDDRVLGTTTISRWSYSCTKALDEFLGLGAGNFTNPR